MPTARPAAAATDVPVFGMRINDAAMQLFELGAMREIAEKLHLVSPKYKLSTFVQGKLFKVRDLIAVARSEHPAADRATDRLAKFVDELEQLQPEQVPGRDDWAAFVTRCGVEAGWEGRLHFDHLLSNFGYDAKTARALQHARVEVTDQKGKTETVQLETHALRWLGKALACYQPDGCMADVVNLVFAMVHEAPPTEYDEATTVATLQQFGSCLASGNFEGLKWIPTHLHIDGELDDSMCWMVMRRIHDVLGEGNLHILLQLPPTDEHKFDGVAHAIAENRATLRRVRVFRDPDSRNAKAVEKGLVLETAAPAPPSFREPVSAPGRAGAGDSSSPTAAAAPPDARPPRGSGAGGAAAASDPASGVMSSTALALSRRGAEGFARCMVFGALNMDLMVRACTSPAPRPHLARTSPHLTGMSRVLQACAPTAWPQPGTTISGSFFPSPGGKGANEAVAVARLGVPTSLVGRVYATHGVQPQRRPPPAD